MIAAEEFISELITPSFFGDSSPAAAGAPVLPGAFAWRGQTFRIVDVLSTWKQSGDCTHGSGERYVRRHCYRLLIQDGSTWEIYFERRARGTHQQKQRWWLYKRSVDA